MLSLPSLGRFAVVLKTVAVVKAFTAKAVNTYELKTFLFVYIFENHLIFKMHCHVGGWQ